MWITQSWKIIGIIRNDTEDQRAKGPRYRSPGQRPGFETAECARAEGARYLHPATDVTQITYFAPADQ
jgi:hypothetical protein